jgi:hypothetical protein
MIDLLGGEYGRYIIGAVLALIVTSLFYIVLFFLAVVTSVFVETLFLRMNTPPAPAAHPVPVEGNAEIAKTKTG